jgi:protein O-mannosyl-transferase
MPSASSSNSSPPAAAWQAWVILGAVAAVYVNSLRAPLLFDDLGAITDNATIRHLATAFSPPTDGSTTTGRPLLNASFALSYLLSGPEAWGHRAVNVAIHALAALTLLGLGRRILGASSAGLAFGLALLWAVHPLQTESITCVAQRSESLCGLLYLFTVYAFARGWRVASVLACAAGMASKEVMVTAPVLVLLYDRTFMAGSFAAAWRARRGYYLALASTWLVLAGLLISGGGTRGVAAGLGLGVSGWSYLLKQTEALVIYLKLAFWPHPLVLDYGNAVATSLGEVWWQGLVIASLLGGTLWALVRRPVLGFAGAAFFLILAPSSSVVPLVTQTIAEHRVYLPLAAVLGLGFVGLSRLLGARAWLGWGTIAVAFAGLTAARNHDYRDTLVIWTDTVEKYPRSARAQNNLAVELQRAGRAAEAVPHAEAAAALQPGYVSPHYIWGLAALDLGRVDEAIAHLERAVALESRHADAHLALGNALMRSGRPAEAAGHFATSLQLKPAADAAYNLAQAYVAAGRADEAEAQLRAALRLDGDLAPARRQLAMTLAQSGRVTEAVDHFRALVRLQPDDASAHANLGNALLLSGQASAAVAEYEAALRLRPGDPRLEENLQLARGQR